MVTKLENKEKTPGRGFYMNGGSDHYLPPEYNLYQGHKDVEKRIIEKRDVYALGKTFLYLIDDGTHSYTKSHTGYSEERQYILNIMINKYKGELDNTRMKNYLDIILNMLKERPEERCTLEQARDAIHKLRNKP